MTPNFALAVAGYYFDQVEGDSGHIVGNLIDPSDFRGEGAGVGAIKLNIAQTSYSFTGKALFDVDNQKRLDGNLYMLSGAFKS